MRRLAKAPLTPFIDGRESVASRRAPTPIRVQNPRGPKSLGPVNACAVAPWLSDTSPDHAPARASAADPVHRWSRIGRVARPSICVQNPRGPKSLGPVNACPVAPWLSDTSPDHAPARESTTGPVYRWSKIGRVARPRQYACAKPEGAEIPRSGKRLHRRAMALRHFPRPCAGSRKHRRPGLSMVENRSRRAPAPICVQNPRGPKS